MPTEKQNKLFDGRKSLGKDLSRKFASRREAVKKEWLLKCCAYWNCYRCFDLWHCNQRHRVYTYITSNIAYIWYL